MDNKEKTLTLDDAYDAMVDYLEKYYEKTKSDDIGLLVGDMMLFDDGISTDPAALDDWNQSVCKIKNLRIDNIQRLTITEAYNTMIDYLDSYRDRTNSKEIATLLSNMMVAEDKIIPNASWNAWVVSVDKILNQNPRVRPQHTLISLDKPK